MVKCPVCGAEITAFDFGIYTYKDAVGCTFECNSCGATLVARDSGPVVTESHVHIKNDIESVCYGFAITNLLN